MNIVILNHPLTGKDEDCHVLEPGDVLRPDDVYNTTSGGWACAGVMGGLTLGKTPTVWARITGSL